VLDNPAGHAPLDGGLFIYLSGEASSFGAQLTAHWDIDDAVTTMLAVKANLFDHKALERPLGAGSEPGRARNGVAAMSIFCEKLCENRLSLCRLSPAVSVTYKHNTLRRGCRSPVIPSKGEVARRYLASVRGSKYSAAHSRARATFTTAQVRHRNKRARLCRKESSAMSQCPLPASSTRSMREAQT
jgi:hypothetical protein